MDFVAVSYATRAMVIGTVLLSERVDYTRLMYVSRATRVDDRYIDNFHVHKFSEEGDPVWISK